MNFRTIFCSVFFALFCACYVSSGNAALTRVNMTGGANADDYASGQIVSENGDNSETILANWTLTTTASNTHFTNNSIFGARRGLQYVMSNSILNSSAVNVIEFTATPVDSGDEVRLTILQSPYQDNDSWNGGDSETSHFLLSWDGLDAATVMDPDDQLVAMADGQEILSPARVRFSSVKALNSEDSWSIQLPTGANSAKVAWSSSDPNANSNLSLEWVSFNTEIITRVVPEPRLEGWLSIVGLFVLGGTRMRRSSSKVA